MPQPQIDVLTIGRSSVDVYPLQIGIGLEDVATFGKFLGGSPTNVAVAASRLGTRTQVLTAVGDDPFGRFVRGELERFDVDVSAVVTLPEVQTSVVFCEVFPPDDFPLYFYRSVPSPELRLGPDHLDLTAARTARLLWLTVTGFVREPSRRLHHAALDARPDDGLTVLDLDYRPVYWPTAEAASEQIRSILDRIDVAVGNRLECTVATGHEDPDRAAEALLAAGVRIAVVKLGPRGVLARTATQRVEIPATPCTVVNGLGAGDGFGGTLCHGLLAGWDLERSLRYASASGAIVASQLECSSAMPTLAEIEQVLELGRVPEGLRS